MATITNRKIVDDVIKANGKYEGDPQVIQIVEYNNMFDGDLAWGLVYEGEDIHRYHDSPACRNPRTIWEYGVGEVNHG